MPRGASPKRERQYEDIKQRAKKSGRYGSRAEEVAARTVNKIRREKGETKSQRSGSKKSSTRASASSSRAAKPRATTCVQQRPGFRRDERSATTANRRSGWTGGSQARYGSRVFGGGGPQGGAEGWRGCEPQSQPHGGDWAPGRGALGPHPALPRKRGSEILDWSRGHNDRAAGGSSDRQCA